MTKLEECPVAFPLVAATAAAHSAASSLPTTTTTAADTTTTTTTLPVVYAINDINQSITTVLMTGSSSSATTTSSTTTTRRQRGCTSISELANDVTVVTSPATTASRGTIIMTVLQPHIEPHIAILDFSNCQIFTASQNIVAIHAFDCCNGDGIQLVLVDAQAVIVTLRFNKTNLQPIVVPIHQQPSVNVRLWNLYEDEQLLQQPSLLSSLTSSMVGFLSSDVLLVACNPYLLCIDLSEYQIQRWDDAYCSIQNNSSGSGLVRGLLSKLVPGSKSGGGAPNTTINMEPVSAIGIVDNDPTSIFTLHANGKCLHWTTGFLSSTSLLPVSVREIVISGSNQIPHPQLWNDDNDNHRDIFLTARIYEHDDDDDDSNRSIFALAIYIPTTILINIDDSASDHWEDPSEYEEGDEEEDDAPDNATRHVVTVVHGGVRTTPSQLRAGNGDDDPDTISHPAIRLHIPKNVQDVLQLQFDPHSVRCQMRAVFLLMGNNDDDAVGTAAAEPPMMLVTAYPPSVAAIVSRKSVVSMTHLVSSSTHQNPNGTEEGGMDLSSIMESAASSTTSKISGGEGSSSSENVIKRTLMDVDRCYLRQLFRQGRLTPPSVSHIRRAMRTLYPRHTATMGSMMTTTTANNIQVEAVLWVHEWRRHRSRRRRGDHGLFSPTTTPRHGRHPSTATKTPFTMTGATPSRDLYDQLDAAIDDDGMQLEEGDDFEQEAEDETTAQEEDYWDNHQQCQDHESCWRQLLHQVYEEEAVEHLPVAMLMASTSNHMVLVRPSRISVLTEDSRKTPFTVLEKLDEAAMSLMHSLDNGSTAVSLKGVECMADDMVAKAEELIMKSVVPFRKKLLLLVPDKRRIFPRKDVISSLLAVRVPEWLALFRISPTQTGGGSSSSERHQHDFTGLQTRLAAATVAMANADKHRRLCLGRFLALSAIGSPSAADLALRMYLQLVAAMDVAVRMVPFPPDLEMASFSDQEGDPPKKRSRLTSVLESIGTIDKTYALDSLLIGLGRQLQLPSSCRSICDAPYLLGQIAFQAMVGHALPELALAITPDCANFTNFSHVLRLLSPYQEVPEDGESEIVRQKRTELLAECLLEVSRSETPDRARALILKAFDLLFFTVDDIDLSMHRVSQLQHFVGTNNVLACKLFTQYIDKAITTMKEAGLNVEHEEFYARLWSILFHSGLDAYDWNTAYRACTGHPQMKRRAENKDRLVKEMVRKGDLATLALMCSDEEDFYEVAVRALVITGTPDFYSPLSQGQEPPADYLSARYALHVSKQEWKRAAETLDERYLAAKAAFAKSDPALSLEQQEQRERSIVNDLVLSAVGCCEAMKLISDEPSRYLSPMARAPDIATNRASTKKHGRQGGILRSDGRPTTQLSCFMNMDDLVVRAVRAKALKTLSDDSKTDSTFPKSAFISDVSQDPSGIGYEEIIEQLYRSGYYTDGLALAHAMDAKSVGKLEGRGVFHDFLSHLACDYLVAILTEKVVNLERPTITQLQEALNSLSKNETPVVLALPCNKKFSDLQGADVRFAADVLLRKLTVEYTSADMPIAKEVARAMLSDKQPAVALPAWLEKLLLTGTVDERLPGLFARRRKAGMIGYLGDPQFLLHLYTIRGLCSDACRIVTKVLAGPDGDFGFKTASSRLPEKGDLDWLPSDKIDFLWNLAEVRLEKGFYHGDEKEKLLSERSKMETALEKHFENLEISDAGLISARTLS